MRMTLLRDFCSPAWPTLFKLAPRCGYHLCRHAGNLWRRMRQRRHGVRMRGTWYCQPECLESALREMPPWTRIAKARAAPAPHRMPLGLMLLSREQLSVEQLRSALEAQRNAGRGRIGEWLLNLGFATEQQITAALARQWSCPVLRTDPTPLRSNHVPEIPRLLLESFHMVPVDFVPATSTLHVAFSGSIDYRVLYALEQMLECRTVPCLIRSSVLRRSLFALAEHRASKEIVFERVADGTELSRIIGSYAATMSASEIRMAPCADYFWVRLQRAPENAVHLLFRTSAAPLAAC